MPAETAVQRLVILVGRSVVGTSRCIDVGQRLPVAADDVVADVGQTDGADQERVQVLLLVDDASG